MAMVASRTYAAAALLDPVVSLETYLAAFLGGLHHRPAVSRFCRSSFSYPVLGGRRKQGRHDRDGPSRPLVPRSTHE